jgi:hypothetical protein
MDTRQAARAGLCGHTAMAVVVRIVVRNAVNQRELGISDVTAERTPGV